MFDDAAEASIKFWGVAAVLPALKLRGSWTLYYLGLSNKDIQFAQGRGRDARHTLGVGWRTTAGIADFNYDLILQKGDFKGGDVNAWGVSTETGFRPRRSGGRGSA